MSDVAPSSNKVQIEAISFNQPVSESSASSMAALANYLREVVLPVGSFAHSMLDESTFQAQNNSLVSRWILADGRSVVGSAYQSLTGFSNVPDLRGYFLRGKGTGNPDGDLPVGTFTASKNKPHSHGVTDPGHTHVVYAENSTPGSDTRLQQDLNNPGSGSAVTITNGVNSGIQTATTNISIDNSTDNESAPSNVTCNIFIRIN